MNLFIQFFFGETVFYIVAQVVLDVTILLPQPCDYGDYKFAPP
jgi:hypothetical protein